MTATFPEIAPLAEVADLLLADVAVRIQLSPTNYQLAVSRYEAISAWLERDNSPLRDHVQLLYPQGSMAIGATISAIEDEDFDIDLIAQLDLPLDTPPHRVLNTLDAAIRGDAGSRYFSMTTRCTRCVQVRYENQMHLDVTPMLRRSGSMEREGLIMHSPERVPTQQDAALVANPYGFAQWFTAMTPPQADFAVAFAAREREYEGLIAVAKAESEPVPAQEAVHRKSMAVVALQLIKRWRSIRYANRAGRCPASVFLARSVAEATGRARTLSQELLEQAHHLRATVLDAHAAGSLIEVRNPVCWEDNFTDRWPRVLNDQAVFLRDLDDLIAKLNVLRSGCDLPAMRAILANLFGERPTADAIVALNRRTGNAIRTGRSYHAPSGGRLDLAASGVIAATAVTAPGIVRATPAHTNFGGEWQKR